MTRKQQSRRVAGAIKGVPLASRQCRVAIVGGGLAGLAAAARLVDQGVQVEIFEARRHLGGRAGSFNSLTPDHGQHVSLGCCTALAALLDQAGLSDTFEPYRRMHFIGPDGRRRDLAAAAWLPAPLHLLPSLLCFDFLSRSERWRLARAVWAMKNLAQGARNNLPVPGACHKAQQAANCQPPANHDEPVANWLRHHGQTPQAIDRFWSPLLVSALSETVDHASLHLSRKVVVDGLLGSRKGYELHIPRLSLAEIFDRRLGRWLESRGVTIHRLARVAQVEGDAHRIQSIVLAENIKSATAHGPLPTARCPLPAAGSFNFDAIILAVPWDRVTRLLSSELLEVMPNLKRLDQIESAGIVSVHLTYDRPITDLPHAVLVGRLGQWIFAKPDNRYQVILSASHRLVDCSRDELALHVERELAEVFPDASGAHVLHRRVVVQPRAVFSVCPGIESLRPQQATPIENLALAGDWTATGWPATMESAVRSGNAAAAVIWNHFQMQYPSGASGK